MTDATANPGPAPAPGPKPTDAKPADAPTPTAPAAAGDGDKTPLDLLRDRQSSMLVALVVVLAVVGGVLLNQRKANERDARAWAELSELRNKTPNDPAGFEDLALRHRGTSADPFIRITWAARLYEAGSKPEVEKARDLLNQVVQEHGDSAFVRDFVAPQAKKIEEELANPKAKHPAQPKPPAPKTGTEAAFPPTGE